MENEQSNHGGVGGVLLASAEAQDIPPVNTISANWAMRFNSLRFLRIPGFQKEISSLAPTASASGLPEPPGLTIY